MLLKYSIFSTALTLFIYGIKKESQPSDQTQNNPPQVKIIKPKDGLTVKADLLVPFEIEVSDEEDGKSDYDEINPNEVLLQIQYASDSSQVKQYLAQAYNSLPPGLKSISRSNCFDCHRPNSTLIGPSFTDVAKKYADDPGSTDYLVDRMISGSKGVWGDLEMPPNPELSAKQAEEIILWILEEGIKEDQAYHVGLAGTFRSPISYAILTAFYHDHAVDGPGQTGRYTMVLEVEANN